MTERTKVGAAIALIGAILGIVLIYFSFLQVYEPIMVSEMADGRAGGETIFLIGQRLNWIGSLAWAAFVIALLNRKKYALRLGLGAALVTLIAGIPLGVMTSMESARFSMFFMAPIFSLLLKIALISPGGNRIVARWMEG